MFTDKLLALAFGLVFLLTIACGDSANTVNQLTDTAQPVLKAKSRSTAFLDYAASTHMLQVELGRLATERGQSRQVQALGEHALAYHTQALASLRKAAVSEAMHESLPATLGTADQEIVKEFRKLRASEFDARYRQYILSSHTLLLERYQEALLKTEKKAIKNWIEEMQPHLRERIQMARVDTAAEL